MYHHVAKGAHDAHAAVALIPLLGALTRTIRLGIRPLQGGHTDIISLREEWGDNVVLRCVFAEHLALLVQHAAQIDQEDVSIRVKQDLYDMRYIQ